MSLCLISIIVSMYTQPSSQYEATFVDVTKRVVSEFGLKSSHTPMCTADWFVNAPQGRMEVMEDGHGDSSRYAFPRFVMVLLDRTI